MNEQKLWDLVAKQMKIDEVPPPVREEAVEAGYVADVLDPHEDVKPEDLLEFARRRMRFHRRMQAWEKKQGSDKQGEDIEPALETLTLEGSEREAWRAGAFEEYLAKIAACERAVFEFRKRFLDGELLSPEQARDLISSPAAAYLPSGYLASSGTRSQIPAVAHNVVEYEVQPEESDEYGPYIQVSVIVDPPGEELTAQVRGMERLLFPDENNYPQEISVGRGTVLNELRWVSTQLAQRYPWHEAQATWFVLTGEPPAVPAATGRVRAYRNSVVAHSTITLTIQPWVSAKTVSEFYQRLQDRVFVGKPRSSSERNLAVFRFVISQLEVQAPDKSRSRSLLLSKRKPKLVQPSWRTLLERWNQKYPEGHEWYYKDLRNFSKDYRRGEQAVLHPRYRIQTNT